MFPLSIFYKNCTEIQRCNCLLILINSNFGIISINLVTVEIQWWSEVYIHHGFDCRGHFELLMISFFNGWNDCKVYVLEGFFFKNKMNLFRTFCNPHRLVHSLHLLVSGAEGSTVSSTLTRLINLW